MSIVEVSLGSTAQLLDVVEGRKTDPLYRAQRLLTKAHERHDKGYSELTGLLAAGDPAKSTDPTGFDNVWLGEQGAKDWANY